MRVAIINLTGGRLSGGYRKYLENILPLMAEDERVAGIDVYLPDGYRDITSGDALTFHSIPAYSMHNRKKWLRNELARNQFDVVYIPSAMWINCGHVPVVTMIQNMEPLIVPFQGNPLKECIRNIGRYLANLYACRRAHRIIAISKFVKTYLIERWRIKSDRIGLVYHGINPVSQQEADGYVIISLLKSFPFIFTAGSIRPARGLEDIIEALSILKTKTPFHLVIAGNVDPGMEQYVNKLKKMATNLGISEEIHWIGKLNSSEMSWYFKNCEAFVMTSRVESFGMIAGEAMAHGAVCISADNPCLPEIFGDAAVYYPPKNHRALAERILEVTSWPEEKRREMSERAKKRASQFSWDICAQKTIEEFQIAIEGFKARKKRKG